jgi:hypothetical protein
MKPIPKDSWIKESLVRMPIAPPLATKAPPELPSPDGYTFEDFRNPVGSVGTKNMRVINKDGACAWLAWSISWSNASRLPARFQFGQRMDLFDHAPETFLRWPQSHTWLSRRRRIPPAKRESQKVERLFRYPKASTISLPP